MSWFQPSTWFQTTESKHTLSDFNPHNADKFYPQSKVPQDFKNRTEALVSLLNALEDIYRQNQAQIPFEKDEQNGKIFASKNEKKRLENLGNRLSQRVDEALLLEKRGEPEDFHQDADSINVDKNMTESLVTLREKIRDDLTALASALIHIEDVLSKYGSTVEFTGKELDESKAVHFENRVENTIEDIQDFLHLYGEWQEALYEDFGTH